MMLLWKYGAYQQRGFTIYILNDGICLAHLVMHYPLRKKLPCHVQQSVAVSWFWHQRGCWNWKGYNLKWHSFSSAISRLMVREAGVWPGGVHTSHKSRILTSSWSRIRSDRWTKTGSGSIISYETCVLLRGYTRKHDLVLGSRLL